MGSQARRNGYRGTLNGALSVEYGIPLSVNFPTPSKTCCGKTRFRIYSPMGNSLLNTRANNILLPARANASQESHRADLHFPRCILFLSPTSPSFAYILFAFLESFICIPPVSSSFSLQVLRQMRPLITRPHISRSTPVKHCRRARINPGISVYLEARYADSVKYGKLNRENSLEI